MTAKQTDKEPDDMTTTAEIDVLRRAWQALDQRLALETNWREHAWRERQLGLACASLRPLAWGQALLAAFGIAMIVLGVSAWTDARGNPVVVAAGIAVHVYGVLTLIAAGSTLARLRSIDYAAPVLAVQQRLGDLRRWYVGWSRFTGLAWWLLWMPFVICLSRPEAAPLQPGQAWFLAAGLVVGLLGLLGTWLFHRWSRSPRRAALGQRLDDAETGRSILNARAALGAIDARARDPDTRTRDPQSN